MKQNKITGLAFIAAFLLLTPASLLAQKERKEKPEKTNEQQLIITRNNDKSEKVVIEIDGDKVTVNGKPMDEFNDKNKDMSVRLRKYRELDALSRIPGMGFNWNNNEDGENFFQLFNENSDRAMLGVMTEKTDQGVKVQSITKESGAEKAGLKEGDIITKIDDSKIQDPDELSAAIKKHKAGEKVTVTYLRDKKESKTTVELTEWKGFNVFSNTPGFKMDMKDLNMGELMPKMKSMPRVMSPYGQNRIWTTGGPKLGISVQDTEDGKGVKIIEVDEESNAAKAGIKEDDIVTEVDGKTVNSTDEMVKLIKENKEKNSVMIKLNRAGKTQNIEVKMPRKIKTADL